MTRQNENLKLKKSLANGSAEMQKGGRKTVIMEMEEEYSGSDGETNVSPDRRATWQDLLEENNQMKESILN